MERRDVLRMSAAAGAAGVLTLDSVSFAHAAGAADGPPGDGLPGTGTGTGTGQETRTVRGHLPTGAPDWVYLPVEVPRGVREIAVAYRYDRPEVPPGTPGNALDIGIFDERGTRLGGRGFRGWSGGARSEFTIGAERATPGYLPGPVGRGTWHVALGPYTVAPQGMDYEVTVTLRYGPEGGAPEPAYPPERGRGRGRAWYRGDCHLHTVHSDGRYTPADVAAAARRAGLDFLATTEHNTTSGHGAWEGLWGPHPDGELLVLCGEEITTRNGHFLALGTDPGVFVDWRYRARDDVYERFVRRIHRAGGLVVPAHPHCPFTGCQWKFGLTGADAVEVWNGPWTVDDEVSLAAWDNTLVTGGPDGWLPAMGNSDAHREGQEVGLPQTVVLADDLSRGALLEGIREGRSYVAESSAVSVAMSATGPRGEHAGIGGRLRVADDAEVTVRVEVSGAPEGAGVRLMTDQGQLHAARVPSDGVVTWRTTASLATYVRAEVRRPAPEGSPVPGAMVALTNPVWLGPR